MRKKGFSDSFVLRDRVTINLSIYLTVDFVLKRVFKNSVDESVPYSAAK